MLYQAHSFAQTRIYFEHLAVLNLELLKLASYFEFLAVLNLEPLKLASYFEFLAVLNLAPPPQIQKA